MKLIQMLLADRLNYDKELTPTSCHGKEDTK